MSLMKTVLLGAVVVMAGPCWARASLRRVQLSLRYEMKSSLRSLPASSTRIETQNRFTLSVSDTFYAMIDPARSDSLEPLASRPRLWKGEFQVSGQADMTDEEQRLRCVVRGGRALKQGEMPSLALSPAFMGTGNSLSCHFDFPVALKAETVLNANGAQVTSIEAAPGAVPLCLNTSGDATVFRQTIEANPPLSRRPQDASGAKTYDGWKELQKRGEFWLSSPTFFELKNATPNLYTMSQNRAFRFKPSKTESQSWTQSLTLKLAILPTQDGPPRNLAPATEPKRKGQSKTRERQ